jgi:hypothetical protein
MCILGGRKKNTTQSAEGTEAGEEGRRRKGSDPDPFPSPSVSVSSVSSVVNSFSDGLLDGHALGEVARLIHVGSACDGHAVGQKLQR